MAPPPWTAARRCSGSRCVIDACDHPVLQAIREDHAARRREGRRIEQIAPQDAVELQDLLGKRDQIGREHVRTPVTNAHLVCRLMLEKKKQKDKRTSQSKRTTTQKIRTTDNINK